MSTFFSPRAERSDALTPIRNLPPLNWRERQSLLLLSVGRVLLRRIRYAGRFIYWTCKHRSTANAAWVCEYEGYKW